MMMRMLLVATGLLAITASAIAGPKEYQVTGPVLDVTADTITVQKGKDPWEIGRGADTKMMGDVKKGDKVTIMYRMTATSVEAKTAAPAKGSKKK
jgi:hypothetical protein